MIIYRSVVSEIFVKVIDFGIWKIIEKLVFKFHFHYYITCSSHNESKVTANLISHNTIEKGLPAYLIGCQQLEGKKKIFLDHYMRKVVYQFQRSIFNASMILEDWPIVPRCLTYCAPDLGHSRSVGVQLVSLLKWSIY